MYCKPGACLPCSRNHITKFLTRSIRMLEIVKKKKEKKKENVNDKKPVYTEPEELVQVTKPYFPSFM